MKTRFSSYALLGSGKVARHIQYYLSYLELPFRTWSRRDSQPLAEILNGTSHVLLAVSDSAIAELAEKCLPNQTLVHFSGTARIDGVFAAHPLMTFGSEVQPSQWYRTIPFVIDEGTDFDQILPGFPNAHFKISPEQRPMYHALCALAGNSTFLLWKNIGDRFERDLKLPRELLAPFLHQVVRNACENFTPDNFTGPVARGDWATVDKHLRSLNPELRLVYQAFLQQAAHSGVRVPEALL